MWAGWPLSRWFGLFFLGSSLILLVYFWPVFWFGVALGVCWLAYVMALFWSARQRFVCFKAEKDPMLTSQGATGAPLAPEELVAVRASGSFTVEGQTRYYVDVEAEFETVGTREHIVLARVRASRFLLLGRWPSPELGWWYIFFRPESIRELSSGSLCFGPQDQPTIRVVYAPDKDTEETFYLSFADRGVLHRVWADLVLDAPPGVATVGTQDDARSELRSI
jgi:hypothetical protein